MVIWSQPARADLRSIHDFIAHDSHFYAQKVVQDIREKTDVLEQLPKAGRSRWKLNEDHAGVIPNPPNHLQTWNEAFL